MCSFLLGRPGIMSTFAKLKHLLQLFKIGNCKRSDIIVFVFFSSAWVQTQNLGYTVHMLYNSVLPQGLQLLSLSFSSYMQGFKTLSQCLQ